MTSWKQNYIAIIKKVTFKSTPPRSSIKCSPCKTIKLTNPITNNSERENRLLINQNSTNRADQIFYHILMPIPIRVRVTSATQPALAHRAIASQKQYTSGATTYI